MEGNGLANMLVAYGTSVIGDCDDMVHGVVDSVVLVTVRVAEAYTVGSAVLIAVTVSGVPFSTNGAI